MTRAEEGALAQYFSWSLSDRPPKQLPFQFFFISRHFFNNLETLYLARFSRGVCFSGRWRWKNTGKMTNV
jgi:hypothetical protein